MSTKSIKQKRNDEESRRGRIRCTGVAPFEFYLLGGTRPFASFGSSRGRTNKKVDEAGIWVSALALFPIKISPAPPLATVKMTRSPFQVVIGLIPMFRNSPVG